MGFTALQHPAPAVESDIPLPNRRGGGNFKRKYPWVELKVGDSFIVQRPQAKFGNSVWNAEQRYGIKLSTRSVMLKGIPHTRVWRVG